jgi:DNA polymerase III sliding clamp (beta) subunit (PCNA family)
MSVSVSKGSLSLLLSLLSKVAGRGATLPVISQLRLTTDGATLTGEATDLDVYASVRVPAEGMIRPSLVSPEKLTACASAAPGKGKAKSAALVTLDGTDPHGSSLDVATGGRKWTLHGIGSVHDFPGELPLTGKSASVSFDGDDLAGALAFVSPALCTDDTRFNLCGILWEGDRFVATNGHRLHAERLGASMPNGWRPILPPAVATILRAGIAAKGSGVVVKIYKDRSLVDNREGFRGSADMQLPDGASLSLRFRCIDGTFPEVDHVIPRSSDGRVVVDAVALREAFAVVKRFAKSTCGTTKVAINGALEITAENPDDGRFAETVATVGHSTMDLTIGLSAAYCCEALAGFEGDVVMGYHSDLDPVVISSGRTSRVAVIMPVRI